MDHSLHIFSLAFTLFLLMDPIGNVPIFITVLKDIPPKKHSKIILRELLIALFTIIAFAFAGQPMLELLNVKLPTILVSGGIILFLIAIRMIFPSRKEADIDLSQHKEPFIVPLAIPLVAGPAVLAAVMLFSGQEISAWVSLGAIVIAWVASTLILLASSYLKKILGQRGLLACEKLMGLLLTLIAVQMLLEGIDLFMRNGP